MQAHIRLKASDGGWQLVDNGRLSFWFLQREKALEVALAMADCQSRFHGSDLIVEAEALDGGSELIEYRYLPAWA